MTYEITLNQQFNSYEIKFDGKPADAIREALKALKFRWNPKKGIWYGFGDHDTITKACEGQQPTNKATKPATKPAKKNKYGVKVGDYFSISWGYEQTNVDFFQVIALVGESSVRIREVNPPIIEEEATGPMAADRVYKLDKSRLLEPASYSVFIKDQENGDLKRITTNGLNAPHFLIGRSGELATLETSETVKTYESWYY
jgi:hypothetical protein